MIILTCGFYLKAKQWCRGAVREKECKQSSEVQEAFYNSESPWDPSLSRQAPAKTLICTAKICARNLDFSRLTEKALSDL